MSSSEHDENASGSDAEAQTKTNGKKRSASEDVPADGADDDGNFKDKTLKCRDCEGDFIFSSEEQAFHAEKGFDNEPVRCKECRMEKKARMNGGGGGRGGGGRGGRDRGPMTCYNCGGEGHMSRDCPQERKERGPLTCYNCQGEGHISRDCPQGSSGGGRGGGRGRGGGGRGGGRGRGGGGSRW